MAIAAPAATVRDRLLGATDRIGRVKALDRLASWIITLGGLSIIVAVLFIFVFITSETVPLFRPAQGESLGTVALGTAGPAPTAPPARALLIGVDEYQLYAYALYPDARLVFYRTRDGAVVREFPLDALAGATVTAGSRSLSGDFVGAGTSDGRVLMTQVRFRPKYEQQKLVDLELEVRDRGLVQMDRDKQPIRELTYAEHEGHKAVASVSGDGAIAVYWTDGEGAEKRETLHTLGGERVTRVRLSRTTDLMAGTETGGLQHWLIGPEIRFTEAVRVGPSPITALEYLVGGGTILAGDADGRLSSWFRVRATEEAQDLSLVRVHEFPRQSSAIRAIGRSPRDKSFVAAGADGSLVLSHATSQRTLLRFPAGVAADEVLITPKADGIVALRADGRLARYTLANPHPEVSWRTLFGKVWYEGYATPAFVWQSTGATDDFEPKFSLVPVIFGTIKGTVYALLFAVPLAILSALYTSQFMHPSLRSKIKPFVEIMAALPSVVIGFIAGLWLASRVERQVVPLLLMVVLLPLFGTAGILLWERLPRRFREGLRPGMEVALILPLLLLGSWVALHLGPWVEAGVFQGDFRLWLGSALGLVYDQRNCLVVGLAMGFAVIPIIFTIAEDSFASVPQHLTAASLALGASRWQTALRVVLPTASPGVFSAVMIGFGRAVGETMIVLMATGNTPVMDWSIFDGMRTLSANVAVEIPEAPHGGTLYRMLFLAALLLFAMTFVVNTLAEIVRQRLRDRFKAI